MSVLPHNQFPAASLIICSRNRPELLADTVDSILQGALVPTELIVVDQSDAPHPTLENRSGTRGCTLRYLRNNTIGVSKGRNSGVAAASHPVIAITDDDMIAPVEWFGALIRELVQAGENGVVIGQVTPIEDTTPGSFAPSITPQRDNKVIYHGRVGADVLYSGNMAMYRATFERVGGFDERLGPGTRFPAAEDNDLGYRLLEAGCQFIYTSDALLYHRAWRSNADYQRLRWSYGVGQGAFYAKHLSIRDRYMLSRMFSDMGGRAFRCARNLVRDRSRAQGDALFIAGILSGALRWLGTRPTN